MLQWIEHHAIAVTLGAFGLLGLVTTLVPSANSNSQQEQAWKMALVSTQYNIDATRAVRGRTPQCQVGSPAHRKLTRNWQQLHLEDPALRGLQVTVSQRLNSCPGGSGLKLQPPPALRAGAARLRALGLPDRDIQGILELPQPRRLMPGERQR